MKIEGRCRSCKRDFPIDLLLTDAGGLGRCPFCGEPLDLHYGAVLVDTLRRLQQAGTAMQGLLERATSLGPGLEIDVSTVIEPLRGALRAREAGSAERRATEETARAERAGT